MMIRDLNFSSTSGGSIVFVSLLRDQSLVPQMEERFRDLSHVLLPGQVSSELGNSRYNSRRSMTIRLSREATTPPMRIEQTPPTPASEE
jgi:hypothetical protein